MSRSDERGLIDLSAEELLEQIKIEKQHLIAEGKIKKDKNESTIIKRGNSYFEIIGTTEKCIDDELPFEIPDSWRWARFGSCGIFTRGNGIKRNETIEKGFPCVRYGQLYTTYKTRFSKAVSFIPKELFDKCYKIQKKDILMALTGENNVDIALAVAYEGDEELAMGGDMTKFSNHCMNPLYLVCVINSVYGIRCKSKLSTGDIIVHISNDKLASILIPIPPLAEQQAIVEKVEECFDYLNNIEKAYSSLTTNALSLKSKILELAIQGKLVEQRPEEGTAEELYKQIQAEKAELIKQGKLTEGDREKGTGRKGNILATESQCHNRHCEPSLDGVAIQSAEELYNKIQVIKQELTFQGKIKKEKPLAPIKEEEIPFDIPDTWKWVKLKDLCVKIVDGSHNPPNGVKEKTDYIMMSSGNINYDKLIDFDKVRYLPKEVFDIENNRTKASKGDIFLTIVATLGRSCVYDGEHNVCFQRSVAVIKTLIFNKYLKYVFDSPFIQTFIKSNATGTAQKGFYLKQLENLIIPLPPLAEQHRIVAKIEELFTLVDKLSK